MTPALALLTLLCAVWGCKNSELAGLSPVQIHAITKDLADAARVASPRDTHIRVGFQAAENHPKTADQLDITLFPDGLDAPTRPQTAKIEQSLDAVATRNGLIKQRLSCRKGICFSYLKSGAETHIIHIQLGAKRAETSGDAFDESSGSKLAIILDDLGSDWTTAEAIFALPYPLTISILPNHEHSMDIARDAERRGYEVLLHLPMQSVADEKPEARELRCGMSAAEVGSAVEQFLETVPGAVGINNHQGSQATSDAQLMSELMAALSDRHLFYVDSRTTSVTVAYDTAQKFGVPSAYRNVPFLDDLAETASVRKQLDLALRDAREKGEAIAIGHPHPATLEALRDILPQAPARGVRLVFVSQLVH